MERDRTAIDEAPGGENVFADGAESVGLTASSWLDEQRELTLRGDSDSPTFDEIEGPGALRTAEDVLARLRRIDWAFRDADTQYRSHDIHPYPAKFIPQIPGHLVANLSTRGELVFDPFGGSGTTALEALRLGRRSLSVDANPLAAIIGRVKTGRLDRQAAAELRALRGTIETRLDDLGEEPKSLVEEFEDWVPDIPNINKWFPPTSRGELALIASHISQLDSAIAGNIARLAMSRVVLGASFQDSETRYASKPKEIPAGTTLRRFLENLGAVVRRVASSETSVRYGSACFVTEDSRTLAENADRFPDNAVDLVVTSPPYGNANDYHLYHRFRLFWLGFDPREFGHIEIGSHLRHQREGSGFHSYIDDLRPCFEATARMLKPGRYAAFVLGDSIYDGETYRTSKVVADRAAQLGFECVGSLTRDLHDTKRAFGSGARRAEQEDLVLLRVPPNTCRVFLHAPDYSLWEYEKNLRTQEIDAVLGATPDHTENDAAVSVDPYTVGRARHLTFTKSVQLEDGREEPTWQNVLEDEPGSDGARKNSKYVTHGLHPYKGKFYPQLVKSLLNLTDVGTGSVVLDPFCGSGTALLEAKLNGLRARGCDMHPLAAKIARAKVGILDVDPRIVLDSFQAIDELLPDSAGSVPRKVDEIAEDCLEEIESWFPEPVVYKLNAILSAIRAASGGVVREFYEVLVSSIVRDVSQQDPSDLRIRRRDEPLDDAPAIDLFRERCHSQLRQLESFWEIHGYCPFEMHPATVVEGDAREGETFQELGLDESSVDVVLTSPPYATALPYIDTDRLSLLLLNDIDGSERRPLERSLTGSREILKSTRRELEEEIKQPDTHNLPDTISEFIVSLYEAAKEHDVGFRRRNKPALLLRFFRDMRDVLDHCQALVKDNGEVILILGDNSTTIGDKTWQIPTRKFVQQLGEYVGLNSVEAINISVTKDNMKHIQNAITDNTVFRMR